MRVSELFSMFWVSNYRVISDDNSLLRLSFVFHLHRQSLGQKLNIALDKFVTDDCTPSAGSKRNHIILL